MLLASWGVEALRVAAPNSLPRLDEIALDGRVLAFALVGSVLTGLLFGMAPVLQQRASGPGRRAARERPNHRRRRARAGCDRDWSSRKWRSP